MMERDCERWIAIADAAVLGDPVSAAEQEFEREHRAVCARCRGEASLWSSLRPSRLQVVPSAEDVDEIVRLFTKKAPLASPTVAFARSPRRFLVVTAGAALLSAAGLLFWIKSKESVEPSRLPASAATPATHAFVTGRYSADTCGNAGEGVTLCITAGSEVSDVEFSPPHGIVRLERGRAVASLTSPSHETSLSLVTEHGKVTAVGATFSVELEPHGKTAVRVHEGEVRVSATGSTTETLLGEGQASHLGAEKIETVPKDERERDLRLLPSAAIGVP